MKYNKVIIFIILTLNINLYAKLTAIVSIEPQATFLKQIAKDKIDIELMINNGVSVHNYSPKPSQMKSITKANLYFTIGVEFEKIWLNKFHKINKNMKIINTDKNIKKLMIKHSSIDPHIWTTPTNVKIIAKNILDALVKYDKKNKSFFINNYNLFIKKIDNTDNKIKNILKKIPKKTKFMVFHPSWGYFAKEYDLIQMPIEVDGKNPKSRALKILIQIASKNNIKAIFVNPNSSNKIAKIISNELNINLVRINTLNKNWSNNLINLAKQISH
jgi:zinc transport system substrate-binding protein